MTGTAMNHTEKSCDRKKLTHAICTLQAVSRSSEIIAWLKSSEIFRLANYMVSRRINQNDFFNDSHSPYTQSPIPILRFGLCNITKRLFT